jgi:hypothetical protein
MLLFSPSRTQLLRDQADIVLAVWVEWLVGLAFAFDITSAAHWSLLITLHTKPTTGIGFTATPTNFA